MSTNIKGFYFYLLIFCINANLHSADTRGRDILMFQYGLTAFFICFLKERLIFQICNNVKSHALSIKKIGCRKSRRNSKTQF